jgi:hypothetical protein
MSKKKNKPCITEDKIRKVLEETVMNSSSINKSEWNFCASAPGVFYWENIFGGKARIGALWNSDTKAWEIYGPANVVYIIIYPNIRSISWEGGKVVSTSSLQALIYDAFIELSELIKDESAESKVVETSERKLISKEELIKFINENMSDCLGEFFPDENNTKVHEWALKDGSILKIALINSTEQEHWMIASGRNVVRTYIELYNDHIIWMMHDDDRMLKLFNDLENTFNLKTLTAADMYHAISEIPQEVVETETNETSEKSKIEGEKEMENKDNYIKMDGEKDSFEGGAIRYTKKGKGRYDLIPSQQIHDILDYAKLNWDSIIEKDDKFCSIYNVLMSAYPDADDLTYDNYIEIIINIIRYCYIVTSNNQNFYAFVMEFVKMLKDLAIHYEMGAEKYGVDNWKKGIPETKGERGGSFRDSGLRHLQQLLDGQTDEPHQIAAIWNFIGAMYVKKHQDTCENCDEMKNPDWSKISNGLKDLQRKMSKDCDQDINKLINAMLVDTVIDLSHPDPDMKFQCFLMGNIHTNNFGIVFNPNNVKDFHIFNKDKVSITVFREYCNNKSDEHFEITGIDIHGVQCKLNIDRLSSENSDSEFNVKAELSTALEVRQAPQEAVLYKFDFRSTPKKISKDLWDRFYYNFLRDAVEVRPV